MNLSDLVRSPEGDLFYTRRDPKDPRMGELVRPLEREALDAALPQADLVFVGVPEDRGIVANRGRPGAVEGPRALRRLFYRMTPGFNPDIADLIMVDAGDVRVAGCTLEEVHQRLRSAVAQIAAAGALPVVFGGGHDLSFPGLAGLVEGLSLESSRLGVVNVDSHLDVRDLSQGVTSGTPFYRALTELPHQALLGRSFVEYSVQEPYNSPVYYQWVREQGATVMTYKTVSGRPMEMFLQALRIAGEQTRAIGVSVDIDAASNHDAPGASSSNPSGLSAEDLEKIAYLAGRTEKVRYLDIMELSPPLDQDGRTASLCASVLFWFLKGFCERR